MKLSSTSNHRRGIATPSRHWSALVLCAAAMVTSGSTWADGPGRGATAAFEKNYLITIIDHHYSALRMTELAAGTDTTRDATVVDPAEGTSPSPGFASTAAKAADAQIRSMARMANRQQREEIGKAQHFLAEWYGAQHEPELNAEGKRMIAMLDKAPAGAQFDQIFLRLFSNHHFSALTPSLHCQVKSDLGHEGLRRYCQDIVVMQTNGINDMRDMLCKQFSECGFVPRSEKGKDLDL